MQAVVDELRECLAHPALEQLRFCLARLHESEDGPCAATQGRAPTGGSRSRSAGPAGRRGGGGTA